MNDRHADFEPLLDIATPHIYRRNMFRVLGLQVNATPREARQRRNRKKMQEKLGIKSSDELGGSLALEFAPSDDDIHHGIERMNRPVDRLIDEIFWFWPTNSNADADQALDALGHGEVDQARKLWEEEARLDDEWKIATHNLAVSDHLEALDSEVRYVSEGLDFEALERLADRWLRSLARWKEVIEDEGFWNIVKNRARDMEDLQLTTGLVRRIRDTLPKALLLINAKISFDAAARSDIEHAQWHIRMLKDADLGYEIADEVIIKAIEPAQSRIKISVDNAKSRWTSTPQLGNQYVRELDEQTRNQLDVADSMLPLNDLFRESLHDTVADAMLQGTAEFGNCTNDWQECIKLLELAQGAAAGETMQMKLSETSEILATNAESANDWCSSGYWELPKEDIKRLESARESSRAGDFDGAIQALAGLGLKIGTPLRRCLSYALCINGNHIANEAISGIDLNTETQERLLNRLREMSESALIAALQNFPNPRSSYPPLCLCCGRGDYTRWNEFTLQETSLFWCERCANSHRHEFERKTLALKQHLWSALEYVLLADEIDPGNNGVAQSLESLKGIVKDLKLSIPTTNATTNALKKRLVSEDHCSGTPHSFDPSPIDRLCYYCSENRPDESCRIIVPMCGDLQKVEMFFNIGSEYRYADVIVPRCRSCRDKHRELPGRAQNWIEASTEATKDNSFPEILEEVNSAERALIESRSHLDREKKKVDKAEAVVRDVESIGTLCNVCGSHKFWKDGLCSKCDKEVFRLGAWPRVLLASATVIASAATLYLIYVLVILFQLESNILRLSVQYPFATVSARILISALLGLIVILELMGLIFAVAMKRRLRIPRDELRTKRKSELLCRRQAEVEKAQSLLDNDRSSLKSAEDAAQTAAVVHGNANDNLRSAKEKATAEFELIHPEPSLGVGVKPEDDYVEFSRIKKLQSQGWMFGYEPQTNNSRTVIMPVGVKGLCSTFVSELIK